MSQKSKMAMLRRRRVRKKQKEKKKKEEETAYGKVNMERTSLEVSAVSGTKSFPTTDFGLPILTLENLCITQEII